MVCKENLRIEQMTCVDLGRDSVNIARGYADRMVEREKAEAGDIESAMRRIETATGFPFSVLWGLRYRPPKTIDRDVFKHLRRAYLKVCARQIASLMREMEADAIQGTDDAEDDLVVEAEAVAAKLKAAMAKESQRTGGRGR